MKLNVVRLVASATSGGVGAAAFVLTQKPPVLKSLKAPLQFGSPYFLQASSAANPSTLFEGSGSHLTLTFKDDVASSNYIDSIPNAYDKSMKQVGNTGCFGLDDWGLFDALSDLDMVVTQEGCRALLAEFDEDKNGVIDRNEFLALVQSRLPKDVFEIFCAFEHRGYLTPGKLRAALGALSVDVKSSKTKELMAYYDANGDGKLGPLGFAELVSRSPTAKFWLKVDPSGRIRRVKALMIKGLKSGRKKVVSTHSTLTTVYTGLSMYSLSMLWAPGLDAVGSPCILNIMKTFTAEQERVFQYTSVIGALGAIAGSFRIPPNATSARRNLFMAVICLVVNSAVVAESNLCMAPHLSLIDAWSWPGRVLTGGTTVAAMYYVLKLLHNSIVDPIEGKAAT